MALFADDDLGQIVDLVQFLLPAQMLGGAGAGLGAAEIVGLAIHEHDGVGVLLDRAGFAKVGKLRALIFALFDLTRELRQGDDGNAKLFGQGFQAHSDLADLLHPAISAGAFASGD